MIGESMIESHIPLAYRISKQVAYNKGVISRQEREEMTGDALLGLVQAAHAWRADRKTSFGVYARKRIRWAIYDGQRKRKNKVPTVSIDVVLRLERGEI